MINKLEIKVGNKYYFAEEYNEKKPKTPKVHHVIVTHITDVGLKLEHLGSKDTIPFVRDTHNRLFTTETEALQFIITELNNNKNYYISEKQEYELIIEEYEQTIIEINDTIETIIEEESNIPNNAIREIYTNIWNRNDSDPHIEDIVFTIKDAYKLGYLTALKKENDK